MAASEGATSNGNLPGGQQASWPDPAQPCPGVRRADLPAPAASPGGGALPGTTSSPAASPDGGALHGSHSSPTSTARNHGGIGGLKLGRSTERSWR